MYYVWGPIALLAIKGGIFPHKLMVTYAPFVSIENIFPFYSVCFVVKYLVKSKIFSVNQINLDKFV